MKAEEEPRGSKAEELQKEVNPVVNVLHERIQHWCSYIREQDYHHRSQVIEQSRGHKLKKSTEPSRGFRRTASFNCRCHNRENGNAKKEERKKTKEPFWKRRIKRNIGTWRKSLSTIEEVGRENI